MNIYERSADVEKAIEVETREAKSRLSGLEGELETARKQAIAPAHIQDLETRWEKVRSFNAETMNDLQRRLKQARQREQEQAKQEEAAISDRAAKVRDELKDELRAAWVQSGGDLAGFEEAWPGLYQAEMTKRTQATFANADKIAAQNIRRSGILP